MVLETIERAGQRWRDRAVPILVTLRTGRVFGGAKLRALKERSVDALGAGGEPKAAARSGSGRARRSGLRKIGRGESRG